MTIYAISNLLLLHMISLNTRLLRNIYSFRNAQRHVSSNPRRLQSIVRSQENGIDVFQSASFRLGTEEVEDDHGERVGADVDLLVSFG